MRRRIWLVIAAIVLAAGIGFTAFALVGHEGANPLTVTELRSQSESIYGRPVRIGGRVAPGSISWDSETKVIKFALIDDTSRLAAVYQGIVPDNFKPGADLVVEGQYLPDDVFEITSFDPPDSLCALCH